MYPNDISKKMNCGMASKNKSKYDLKYTEFIPFKNIPNNIYITPIMIENFILKEFIKEVSF